MKPHGAIAFLVIATCWVPGAVWGAPGDAARSLTGENVGEGTSPAFEVYLGSGFVSPSGGGTGAAVSPAFALYLGSGFGQPASGIGAASSTPFALYLGLLSEGFAVSPPFLLDTGGTPCNLPTTPTGLTVTNLGTGTTLKLMWNAVPGASGYGIRRSDGFGRSQPGTEYTDTGLTRDTTYTYTVFAVNACGAGPPSAPVSRTPDYYPVLLVNGICSDAHLWTNCSVPALGVTEVPNCQPADASRLGDALHAKGLSRVWVVGYDRNKKLYPTVPAIMTAIDVVLTATGEQKLNLVAHSQGGLICRSLLQTKPGYRGKVDNLIMIGTPNHGTALANLAVGNIFAGPFSVRGKIKAKVACLINTDAVYDLVPGSGFLQQLNYGTEPCSQSHRCDTYLLGSCGSHEPEDLPRDATGIKPDYWLLAGTGQWCGLEQKFSGLIGCAPNDGVVALESARLQALPNDHWTTDKLLDPGFLQPRASHYGLSASACHPEEVRYDKFADAVYRVLTGVINPLAPPAAQPGTHPAPASALQTTQAAVDSLETSFLPSIVGTLVPGVIRRDTVVIDSCAEAGFLQSLEMPGAGLELVGPSGQRITPADTVSGAARYSRDDGLVFQELTVINPESGSWVVESHGPPSGSSQNFELSTSVVAAAALRISLLGGELTPGMPVNIRAWLDLPSGPDVTAAISGMVVAPDTSLVTLSFYDDGAHGDGVAGDGAFGATYTPILSGAYDVSVQAAHLTGASASLSRARTAAFVVEAMPDLAVAVSDVIVARARPGGPSDSLLVTATIHNLGGVDASGARALFLNSSGVELHSEAVNVVAAGQAVVTAIWTPAHPSLDTLVVVADANFAFLQQRYDNDTARVVLSPELVTVENAHPPREISLAAGYPNPSVDGATISFSLPRAGEISLRVYDIAGRLVRTLVEGSIPPGSHSTRWDGRTDAGAAAPSGVYFYRLRAEGRTLARRLVMVR